jgi:WD40 repeat protein
LVTDTAFLIPPGLQVASIVNPTLGRPARLSLHDLASSPKGTSFDLAGLPLDGRSFSPDGQWLATLRPPDGISPSSLLGFPISAWTKAQLVLHRLPEGKEQVIISGDSIPASCAFSPDSQFLAVGYRDGSVRLYRVPQKENIFHCRFDSRPINGLAFVGEATLAVTDGEGTVKFVALRSLQRELAEFGLAW